jgi:myo-inositol-1(or 4)-monophosphatase
VSYEAEMAFAKDLALEAGGVMRRYFRAEDIDTTWKDDNSPLTIADTTINSLVIDQVKTNFPEYGVLGEEESFKPERDRIWVVDPIDGTVPFSLGMPMSTFSLALVNRTDGQPVVAVTYDPWLEELYSATKGDGAFRNGKPIKTSEATDFHQAYMAVSSRGLQREGIDYRPTRMTDALRDKGAKVLGMASFVYTSNRIAAGQFVGSMIGNPGVWDIAASALLVEEAGGIVTDLNGDKRRFDEDGLGAVLAANQTIFAKLMDLIQQPTT